MATANKAELKENQGISRIGVENKREATTKYYSNDWSNVALN